MDNYLTTQQAAKLLNVSVSTVYQLRLRGLPFHKLGTKTIRYDRREIENWMDKASQGIDRIFEKKAQASMEPLHPHSEMSDAPAMGIPLATPSNILPRPATPHG